MRLVIAALVVLLVAVVGLAISGHALLLDEDPLWGEPPVLRMACTYWNGREIKTYDVTWDKTANIADFDCPRFATARALSKCHIVQVGRVTWDDNGKYRCSL